MDEFRREIVEEEWPDFKGKVFRDRPKNVVEMLENTVRKYPDREGFISEERRLTFGEFDRIVNRIAAGLQSRGIHKGDRIALLLGIQIEFPLAFFAVMKLGALAVPLNTRFKGEELAYEINDSGSRMLIVDAEYWPFIEPALPQLNTVEKIFFHGPIAPQGTEPFSVLEKNQGDKFTPASIAEPDEALLMYTSGTTGKPKGAILQQRGLVLSAMSVCELASLGPGDKYVCCIPLFHITGLNMVMLSSIFGGVPCVFIKTFRTKRFLEIMSSEKVTHYTGVINIIWLMINHPDFDAYDFSSFRVATFGGSPAAEEVIRGVLAKLPHLRVSVGYGLTESFGMCITTPFKDTFRKIKAVGLPLPLMEAKIFDDVGNELPPEQIGEIVLKGPMITKGYWKKPEATAALFEEGWLRTGDIGKIDEEGFVYVLDRKKDMINRGGEKIYSLEVENVINSHDKVLEVAVVGVPDPFMGEAVKAVIALRPEETATEDEMRAFCAEHLADYKVPKYVEFVDMLPRNPAGKVIKADLRYVPK